MNITPTRKNEGSARRYPMRRLKTGQLILGGAIVVLVAVTVPWVSADPNTQHRRPVLSVLTSAGGIPWQSR